MKYVGGKTRVASDIAGLINVALNLYPTLSYWEQTIGGGSVFSLVYTKNRKYGSDIDNDLMLFWKAVKNGWLPPENVSKEKYLELQEEYKSGHVKDIPLSFFVSHACSYSGKFWGGFAKGVCQDTGRERNYAQEGFNQVVSKRDGFVDSVLFTHDIFNDYPSFLENESLVIYIDPPYKGTLNTWKKKTGKSFDYGVFWNKVRELSRNHLVFISEYTAPDDFSSIWHKRTSQGLKQIKKGTKYDRVKKNDSLYQWVSNDSKYPLFKPQLSLF